MSADPRLLRIAAAALVVRLLLMLARGDYVMYDEGYYLLLARSLREGDGFVLNGLPHVVLSPLPPVLVALISVIGLPILWASRLLAVIAGALLVFPVAAIGRRLGGDQVGWTAALLTAAAPALMTFVPFFPGEGWNLYFGSEPLYLLLVFAAIAAAMRAEETDARGWWIALGVSAAAAFLTRGEGVIAGPAIFLLVAVRLVRARASLPTWRRYAMAALVAVVCASPYLLYLRHELGRWAISGRVQAAARPATSDPAGSATEQVAPPPASASASGAARRGGSVVEDFVWHGGQEAYWEAAYRLEASGRSMASQYWGIAPPATAPRAPTVNARVADSAAGPAVAPRNAAGAGPATDTMGQRSDPPPAAPRRNRLHLLARGIATVVPIWLMLLALVGFAAHRARASAAAWLAPAVAAAILPAILVYVEPRSLLPLVPVAAIGAALAVAALQARVSEPHRRRIAGAMIAAATILLAIPTLRDLARAWSGEQPLQQVATARRAVGAYLDQQLPPGAVVMSWHPALAYHAGREWRVLPYEPLGRTLAYAQSQGASAIVFSRFEPSPVSNEEHPFQVLLLDPAGDSASAAPGLFEIQPVAATPLLVVRRLGPARRP